MPAECLDRIAERLNWAKNVCSGDWEPSKASSLAAVTPIIIESIDTTNILLNFRSTIPVAAVSGIFCYTAGYFCGLRIGSISNLIIDKK
jgi:ABC-type dipeptide/oligopeptide/nickel transport system permease component